MDNEMIERVAKTLKACSGLTLNIDAYWNDLAKEAIKAMLEPTDKMEEAGWELGINKAPIGYWHAMIGAIINEE